MSLPPPLVPVTETALIDEAAVALGQDLEALMERAGEVLAREAALLAPSGTILVVCGPGNNGGDGYVCARLLAQAGREVELWPVLPPHSPLAERMRVRLPMNVRLVDGVRSAPDLVIDAVLGSGTRGRPREPIAGALIALRKVPCRILAADVPSGIGSDLVLPADLTICLQVGKVELFREASVREFKTVDIGILPAAYTEVQPACMRRFPPLKRQGHKGTHGELLVIGGGVFPGALEFACRAAVMTGCDLVRAWTPIEGHSLPPTVVLHGQHGGHLTPADPEDLTPLLARASAVLIGPGLGRLPGCAEAARQAFSLAHEMGVPAIVDADAFPALAETLRDLPETDHRLLLTPHRAEARTLLGAVASDEAIHAFARQDRVVLAKAPVDLVTDGWRWQRNHRGNARMAVGGTGDVVAGLAAGLMARGALPYDAARMAVLWATTAGDALWQEQGPCYDATSLISALPATLRGLLTPLGCWPPVVD